MSTHNAHGFDREVYDCDCGTWWFGMTCPNGGCTEHRENCPRCGEEVTPTVETVD